MPCTPSSLNIFTSIFFFSAFVWSVFHYPPLLNAFISHPPPQTAPFYLFEHYMHSKFNTLPWNFIVNTYIPLMGSSISDSTPKAQETCGKGDSGMLELEEEGVCCKKTSFGCGVDIILINSLQLWILNKSCAKLGPLKFHVKGIWLRLMGPHPFLKDN